MSSESLSKHLSTDRQRATTGNGTGSTGPRTVECSRCGETAPEGRNHCGSCGCFLPSSAVRLEHGARRLVSGRGTAVDQRRMADIRASVVADLGGEGQCSEVQLLLVRDLAFAATLRDLLAEHLAATGPLTKAGKRKAALDAWHKASQRVESLARQIGLRRVPAPAPSLEEVMAGD